MAKHMVLTYLHFRILKISHWKFPKKAAAKSQRSQLGPQVEPLELPPEATERQHLEMMARQSPGTDDGPWIFGGFSHGIFPRKSGQFMGNYMGVYVSNLWQTQVFVREIFSVCFFWGVRGHNLFAIQIVIHWCNVSTAIYCKNHLHHHSSSRCSRTETQKKSWNIIN